MRGVDLDIGDGSGMPSLGVQEQEQADGGDERSVGGKRDFGGVSRWRGGQYREEVERGRDRLVVGHDAWERVRVAGHEWRREDRLDGL